MSSDTTPPFGYGRMGVIAFFLVVAFFALYLDFRFAPPQWIFLDDPIGRFLAFLIIHLGPEIAVVGIGVTLVEYFITLKRINN